MKVAVLGAAGGIGQPLSLLLKKGLPAGSELALYDVHPVVPGVAADLSHIPTGVKVSGHGADKLDEALKGCDIVVIPAGVPRKPGMTRDDLFNTNAGIVRNLVAAGAKACPGACYAIITNPVNSTVPIAAETLKQAGVYDPRKVFGVTTLDVIRTQTFVGEMKGLAPEDIKVNVVGGHSGETIIPLLSQLGLDFTTAQIEQLTPRIQNAGTEVVEAKAGGGSATLSMGEAGARFTLHLAGALSGNESVQCSFVAVEGRSTEFLALPVRLGRNGVEEVLDPGKFSDYERKIFEDMLPSLKSNIDKGLAFARNS
ncbi:MAG: malate dehydrogenase [Gammaproteobacteria bacterium]|nr:malate dehydrogenase [Gammaproteobacteria bacterium]MCP5409250.1 malate dehydrogenase [Chromatiaceae bacterium]MCP5444656.1 malate dehydrogenase [Chromatiaceae bacterium]